MTRGASGMDRPLARRGVRVEGRARIDRLDVWNGPFLTHQFTGLPASQAPARASARSCPACINVA